MPSGCPAPGTAMFKGQRTPIERNRGHGPLRRSAPASRRWRGPPGNHLDRDRANGGGGPGLKAWGPGAWEQPQRPCISTTSHPEASQRETCWPTPPARKPWNEPGNSAAAAPMPWAPCGCPARNILTETLHHNAAVFCIVAEACSMGDVHPSEGDATQKRKASKKTLHQPGWRMRMWTDHAKRSFT